MSIDQLLLFCFCFFFIRHPFHSLLSFSLRVFFFNSFVLFVMLVYQVVFKLWFEVVVM